MGEYAVLFAIVLGAVVGLQGVIRGMIRAKIGAAAALYNAADGDIAVGAIAGGNTTSDSVSLSNFTGAAGTVTQTSQSNQSFTP